MPEENIDVDPYNYKKFLMDPEEISKPIFPYKKNIRCYKKIATKACNPKWQQFYLNTKKIDYSRQSLVKTAEDNAY
jgi:hypothetical protein